MPNFTQTTEGISRSYLLIIGITVALCFTSVSFALKQKQTTGSAQPHCLKGYVCKMMGKNLSR